MTPRVPFPFRLYRGVTRMGQPFARTLLKRRLLSGKEDPLRFQERLGHSLHARPNGALVWLHGASVGETLTLLPLVDKLVARRVAVVLTSGTVTSAQLMAQRLPRGALHQYVPLDAPGCFARFLDHWRPNLALIAESELWPNMVIETHARGIPMVLVNGRMSERSYKTWKSWPRLAASLLERFDLCLTQSAADAERLTNLGAPRVVDVGNLKFDVAPPLVSKPELAQFEFALQDRTVIAAASTHPGEDEAILHAHLALRERYPDLLTLLIPRHPERGDSLRSMAMTLGLNAVQRSRGYRPDSATDIYIGDSIGDMGLYYRLSPIVFMGGSLVEHGGQNPIEPAKLGCALLHGPHIFNFREAYNLLDRERGSVLVRDAQALARGFEILLDHPSVTKSMSKSAKTAVKSLGGALERTLGHIEPYLVSMRLQQRTRSSKGA